MSKDLELMAKKLKTVETLEELSGFANRRFYVPWLPDWTEEERKLIIARKYEIEKGVRYAKKETR